MMKAKYILSIICLGSLLLSAHQAWAQNWSYYDTANVGDMYYDKSRIKQIDKDVISVWTKNILSEKAKSKYFSILQSVNRAPERPSVLSYYEELLEIDYVKRKIKNVSVIFYDQKGHVLYASPKSETGEWRPIEPNSVGEKLSNLVSWESTSPGEAAAPRVDEAAAPRKTVTAAAPVPDKKPAPDKKSPGEAKVPVQTERRSSGHQGSDGLKSGKHETVKKSEQQDIHKKKIWPAMEALASSAATLRVIGGDERFVAFDNQTVLDTKTNLMWAAKDNGQAINWYGAKKYCEKYRGGGYKDWRMPTQDELAGLYQENKTRQNEADQNPLHLTQSINLTACCPWASETRGSEAAYFDFSDGSRWWFLTPGTRINRVLPVRSVK